MSEFQIEYEHDSEDLWDSGRASAYFPSPLESWDWKAVQEGVGRVCHTVRVLTNSGELLASTLLVEMRGSFGLYYLLSPRGPVLTHAARLDSALCERMMQALRGGIAAHFPKALFWRTEPDAPVVVPVSGIHFQPAPWKTFAAFRVHDVQPAWTRVLSLRGVSAEQLLSQMKQKTRYNIRLAEKKGVVVRQVFRDAVSDVEWNAVVDQWIALQDETAQRHGIQHHGADYYRGLAGAQWRGRFVSFVEASYNGEVIAMAVLLSDAGAQTVTYLFGASSGQYMNVMAPYAVQWHAIQYALQAGFGQYDFYGIAPQGAADTHSLAAVSRFKEGFGGEVFVYPGTYDFPIRPFLYSLYRLKR